MCSMLLHSLWTRWAPIYFLSANSCVCLSAISRICFLYSDFRIVNSIENSGDIIFILGNGLFLFTSAVALLPLQHRSRHTIQLQGTMKTHTVLRPFLHTSALIVRNCFNGAIALFTMVICEDQILVLRWLYVDDAHWGWWSWFWFWLRSWWSWRTRLMMTPTIMTVDEDRILLSIGTEKGLEQSWVDDDEDDSDTYFTDEEEERIKRGSYRRERWSWRVVQVALPHWTCLTAPCKQVKLCLLPSHQRSQRIVSIIIIGLLTVCAGTVFCWDSDDHVLKHWEYGRLSS